LTASSRSSTVCSHFSWHSSPLPVAAFSSSTSADSFTFPGVDSYEVSLEKQTAIVNTDLPYNTVLEKIYKTGKKINSATADGVPQSVEVTASA
jgi:hypothetical protein